MRQYNPKSEPHRDAASISAEASPASVPDRNRKILVADGDVEVCESLKTLLSGLENTVVECFSTGQAVLDYAFDDDIVCLVAEADLPDMNGVSVLEQLNARGDAVPTIILADCSDVPTAVRAMQAKAVDFIEKPFVEGLMLKRIKQIMQQHFVSS